VKKLQFNSWIDDEIRQTKPSGFATCDAIFARCLVRATPIDIGKPSLARTRARAVLVISAGEPKRCVHPATSAKASSMEMRSLEEHDSELR
jgi:hypothetical protein